MAASEISHVSPVEIPYVPLSQIEAEPLTYQQAMKSKYKDIWVNAMNAEFKGLELSGTFNDDEMPADRKAVSSRWVYKWKTDSLGHVTKAKARLVARGYSQVQGVDYLDTFAPTPSMTSIRMLAAFACEHDRPLWHLDVEQAYVQSHLDERIFLRLPHGCGKSSNKVTGLSRCLYGLKQSSRSWSKLLTLALKKLGFERCPSDPCIFRLFRGKDIKMIVGVHVDDMILVSSEKDSRWLQEKLCDFFPVKHLGKLSWYMGCSFERDAREGTLKISQKNFASALVERFGITKESDTPASPSVELLPRSENEPQTTEPYREAVGSLMWLANTTRPDLAQAVGAVARHSHDPSDTHWKAVRRVLEYVKMTVGFGLTFVRGSGKHLSAFADSSYAPRGTDCRSISGGVVMYGKTAIAWFSRTQKCVTLSSTESEYVSLSDTVRETLFARGVLNFIQPNSADQPIKIWEDNAGAIQLAENPLSSGRSKHIDVRYHHIREHCVDGIVSLNYLSTEEQPGDMLTKPLPMLAFAYHRNRIMGIF